MRRSTKKLEFEAFKKFYEQYRHYTGKRIWVNRSDGLCDLKKLKGYNSSYVMDNMEEQAVEEEIARHYNKSMNDIEVQPKLEKLAASLAVFQELKRAHSLSYNQYMETAKSYLKGNSFIRCYNDPPLGLGLENENKKN